MNNQRIIEEERIVEFLNCKYTLSQNGALCSRSVFAKPRSANQRNH